MRRALSFVMLLAILVGFPGCGSRTGDQAAYTWQEQYDLGIRYLSEGNYEEAVIAFSTAIEIDPKRADAYIGLADAYEAQGDVEQARKVLIEALSVVDEPGIIQKRLDSFHGGKTTEPPIESDNIQIPSATPALEPSVEPTPTPSPTVETADYTIQQQDLSFYNDDGEALILLTYDLVVLAGENPGIKKINQDLYQKYIDFYGNEGGRGDFAQFLSDPYLTSEDPYYDTGESLVTFNDQGIISIVVTQNWMMGGVHNLKLLWVYL